MSEDFTSWIGKRQTTEDEISLTLVRRAAAMTDMDPMMFNRGDNLPPHWYSMFFTPNAPASQIGHDGHPKKGDFLPPIPLPRRMFVGREVEFLRPLRIGSHAEKISEIASITPREGRSGKLVFLQVKHTIQVDNVPAVIEHQNVVYREAASATSQEKSSQRTVTNASEQMFTWSEKLTIDPVQLFRYSALTWNGHRIHYDADYARSEEGYPACVMNGALTVHLLVDAALRQTAGRNLTHLKARLSSPLFLGDTIQLCGSPLHLDDGVAIMNASVLNSENHTAASVELHFSN